MGTVTWSSEPEIRGGAMASRPLDIPRHAFLTRRFVELGAWRDVNGLSLFSVERGPDGPTGGLPLLFLHGIPTWSFLWRDMLDETRLANRSIALDLLGFGLSDKPEIVTPSVPNLASWVERFLAQPDSDTREVGLVAHDFGALVAAELVARNPARYPVLVMLNTSLRPDGWQGVSPLSILRVPQIGELSMRLARSWMLQYAMYPFVNERQRLTPDVAAGYWLPFEAGFDQTLLRLFRDRPFGRSDFTRWREALATYPGRSLILWGSQDPAFGMDNARDLHALLPDARLIPYRHANHFLPEDRPRAAGRVIRAFTNRLL
jgi:pimeloyl-ACP methyl ester carboxylesterase